MECNLDIDQIRSDIDIACRVSGRLDLLPLSQLRDDNDKNLLLKHMFFDIPLYSLIMYPLHIEPQFGVPDFHREIYSIYSDKEKKFIAVAAPREHSKSTITCLVYSTHQMFFRQVRYSVIVSETVSLSEKHLETIRDEIDENETLRFFFGDLKSSIEEEDEEVYYSKQNKTRLTQKFLKLHLGKDKRNREWYSYVEAKGFTQQKRGSKRGRFRPDLIIIDDPDSEKSTNTPELRAKYRKDFFRATVPSINKTTGRIIVIANFTHEDCLIKNLVDQSKCGGRSTWFTKVYKSGYYDNKPIWEQRWSMKDLEERRLIYLDANDPQGFDQEFENITVSKDRRHFSKRNFFKGYIETSKDGLPYLYIEEKNGEKVNEQEYLSVCLFAGSDPAIGKSSGADYFAFSVIAVTFDDSIYVMEYHTKQAIKPNEIEDLYLSTALKYKSSLKKICTEENGFQALVGHLVKTKFREHSLSSIKLIGISNTMNKIMRISSMQPHNEDGKFWIQPYMSDLLVEMDGFPQAKHEHILDSIEMAFRFRKRPDKTTVGEEVTQKRVESRFHSSKKKYNWITQR